MKSRFFGLAILSLTSLFFPLEHARACGGFFCQQQPMVQAGENILYVMEADGSLEMHVQIVYSGTADAFAWILPVPYVPTLGVGTDAVFPALRGATQPTFQLGPERVEGTCRATPECPAGPSSWVGDGGVRRDASIIALPPTPDPGVSVEFRGVVGPFDTAVLSSGSAEELLAWLRTNGYAIPSSSLELIQSYVDARQYFVALRLIADRSTSEIRPIVLRFPSAKPCLPIRLTAIATTPNLPITAYFLGSARAVPRNYSLAEPTYESGFLYGTSPAVYTAYVDAEIDRLGGQAFVTEYAGATPSVMLLAPDLSDLRLPARSPSRLVSEIMSRFGVPSGQFTPPATDPFVRAVLARSMLGARVDCGPLAVSCILVGTPASYDQQAVLDAVESEVVAPRNHVNALLTRHSTLTRLYTSMSAADMTLDPEFDVDASLPSVSNQHFATPIVRCSSAYTYADAPRAIEYESGRTEETFAGRPSDDASYCAALGRPLPHSCSAAHGASGWPVGWTLAAIALVLTRCRRRDTRVGCGSFAAGHVPPEESRTN